MSEIDAMTCWRYENAVEKIEATGWQCKIACGVSLFMVFNHDGDGATVFHCKTVQELDLCAQFIESIPRIVKAQAGGA